MKKFLSLFVLLWVTSVMAEELIEDGISTKDSLIVLDQIEAVVFGQDAVEIITRSDLNRPSLGGGYRSLDEHVFESQVLIDAKNHVPDDEEAIDADIEQMKREHNLSQQQLEDVFAEYNYTLEDGRRELKKIHSINAMIDMKVRSNLIIPRKEVERYYKENPEIIEANYTIQHLFMPFIDLVSKEKQQAQLEKHILAHKKIPLMTISDPFSLNYSDIAEQKKFICDLEPGQYSMPTEVAGGFEWFTMVCKIDEHVKSLGDSYREIVDILRRPKYEELMNKYRNQLAEHVSIVYLN